MKCIFLVAGYATRLYPLTENFPKSLLEVHGKSILEILIEDLEKTNLIDEYILVSNNKFYEVFLKWKNNLLCKEKIVVLNDGTNNNEERLGAVKDIKFAIDKCSITEDTLVLAGDNILNFSLKDFLSFANQKNTSCVMMYKENNTNKLYKSAILTVNDSGVVTNFKEKPEIINSNLCCPPFYFFKAKDLELVNDCICFEKKTDSPGCFAAFVVANSLVNAYLMPGERIDIGTMEDYKKLI